MDAEFLHDLFGEFGAIDIKRMFSGRGLYARGVMFAIVSRDGAIHFKTDDTTREAYAREKSKPLTFTRKSGQRMVTSYWRLPERLYDEPGELADWAREAVRVAQAFRSEKKPAARRAKKRVSASSVVKAAKTKPRSKAKAKPRTKTSVKARKRRATR